MALMKVAASIPDELRLDTYAPSLRRYFCRRVRNAEVEDLVQDVFLRMQTQVENPPIEHLDRYLFRVAASVLSDRARRVAVRHLSAHEPLEECHHPAEKRTPERVLLDRETLGRTVAAIDELPKRTRDILLLHRFEEMTYGSIAKQFGLSISAVEKHVMKALKYLRDRLDTD